MTASSGALYRVGSVDLVTGNAVIVGVGTKWLTDVIAVAIGDLFTIDMSVWYEVIAITDDTHITLDRVYEGGTIVGYNYAILRNTSGTLLTRIAGQIAVQFNQKQLFLDELRGWLNSNNATENITDSHGVVQTITTPSKMETEHASRVAQVDSLVGSVAAMAKAEFDKIRLNELNNFPVAGWHNVDFDSGFEFQQITGWESKLKVKANKVRIDGVWHVIPATTVTNFIAPNGLQNKDLVSADFADLSAAIVAGGTSLSQSYLNQRTVAYALQKDIESPAGQSTAYIQDSKNNIYSDDGVLRQRTVEFVVERLLETVVIESSDPYQSTINAMLSLGFTQDNEVLGQFKKDGNIAVGVTIIQSRNQGAYDPSYNSTGTTYNVRAVNGSQSGRKWFADDARVPTSIANCFELGDFLGSDDYGRSDYGSIVSGISGHSSGKLYDAIDASDLQDLRMSNIRLSKLEFREHYKRKAIAGKARGFEGAPFTRSLPIANGQQSNVYCDFGIGTEASTWILANEEAIRDYGYVHVPGDIESKQKILAIGSGGQGAYIQTAIGSGTTGNAIVTLIQTHSQANPTRTDIMGEPANLLTLFPDGVDGQWNPYLVGSTPTGLRKILTTFVNRVYKTNDDLGGAWTSDTTATINPQNQFSITPSVVTGLVQYETQAHFTQDDVNSKVLDLGGVFGASHNAIPAGGLLASSVISKVLTSSGSPEPGSVVEVPISSMALNVAVGLLQDAKENFIPTHQSINLASDNATPAVKTLDYLSLDNGVGKLCFAYKEMVWGLEAIQGITANGASYNIVAGVPYKLSSLVGDGSEYNGTLIIWSANFSSPIGSDWMSGSYTDPMGVIRRSSDGQPQSNGMRIWNGGGWGDNNKFEITDNQSTLTDDNGNAVLYGTASFGTQHFMIEE
jgi:uncharacterized membrane protein